MSFAAANRISLNNIPSEHLTHNDWETAAKVAFIVIFVQIIPNKLIYIFRTGSWDGRIFRQNRTKTEKDQILFCISHLIQDHRKIFCEIIVRITEEDPFPLGVFQSYISHMPQPTSCFVENDLHILLVNTREMIEIHKRRITVVVNNDYLNIIAFRN